MYVQTWTTVANKSWEQKSSTKVANQSSDKILWTKILNKFCEQKFEQSCEQMLQTIVVNNICEPVILIRDHSDGFRVGGWVGVVG